MDKSRIGKIAIGVTLKNKELSRGGVASTIITSLNNNKTIRKAFSLLSEGS